jgi:glycosyltransferase involved in cell wall biosynthesis
MEGLVSIIIPCYNAEAFVVEAIQSALNQSYDPIEIVVVDDGSTDSSLSVIKSFDDEITWVTGPNRGVSSARNRGIEIADGEMVKFLDADDRLPEDAVATQVRQLRNLGTERASVYGDARLIDDAGAKIGAATFRKPRSDEDPIAYILRVNPGTQFPLHFRQHLLEVGGFDERLPWAEDYDLHLRLQLSGVQMHYESGTVGHVRKHDSDDRLTNRKAEEFKRDPMQVYRRMLDREEKIRSSCDGEPSPAVRQFLARGFWRGGRRAVWAGYPEAAGRYFEHAHDLDPSHLEKRPLLYRLSAKMMGLKRIEMLISTVRLPYRKVVDTVTHLT